MKSIYQNANEVSQNDIQTENSTYETSYKQGLHVIGYCYICLQAINPSAESDDTVIANFCGHTYHKACGVNQKQALCPVCAEMPSNFQMQAIHKLKYNIKSMIHFGSTKNLVEKSQA